MSTLEDRLRAIVGERGIVSDAAAREPHEVDWRGQYRGRAAVVVKPANTEEVAKVVSLLAAERIAIVPQGGNTSLCGASVPDDSGRQVVVNLSRMNRVRAVDTANNTMTVEAGCVLAALQKVADENDRLFPLSLGAEGSCEIGGNLSTNAGGTGVLRYGNTRELVLGLEVVLPDGRVWDGLRGLRKDNTGYDLKHLFVGAEGTLGIITAAVMKLFPKPRATATAIAAIEGPTAAVQLLSAMRGRCGDRITGFELLQRVCFDLVLKHIPGMRDPFLEPHPAYILVEISDSGTQAEARILLEEALGEAAEAGLIRDAVLASSDAQRLAFWGLRENISEAQKLDGVSIKHDVSVPISRVPEFFERTDRALAERFPDIRIVAFGHVGDGNIHYNCSKSERQAAAEFYKQAPDVNHLVYEVVTSLGGSISAEHGLGQLKREEIKRYKSELELDLMRSIKKTLDPGGIMNPGKVL
ncbi:FAD-binding oxidoreductase [Usitatibacter palustris]|uniref:Putative FAD-linked oxidoreductase n=1 Tax=Usitatibacter palustris TaxID=2732487 RepID=A0A6M4H772_9PROT|nr:FAD-binding oxidoreductase [Usitatibacter palustris]QJR13827.1 putative FAD-linked oxidoreductase [Usitatibacter palustris]